MADQCSIICDVFAECALASKGGAVLSRLLPGAAEAEAEAEEAGILQHANLPDAVRDPKLWMIKCKEGFEAEILISLVNKFVIKAEVGENLGITSAVSVAKG